MPFFKRVQPPTPPQKKPRIPDGKRVYAIGDVHGRDDLLELLLDRIAMDDAARTPAEATVIFLGDLVDRGPSSAGVVERVRLLCREGIARCLIGNHEEVFIGAANGDSKSARAFMAIGGLAAAMSYGISQEEAEKGSFEDLAALMKRRIPREHIAFLAGCEDMITIGDYLFVHAGIRPGVDLQKQATRDLRWIRDTFLESDLDHGPMVIHGHTVSEDVVERDNRICIDTGAYAGGPLTAIGLEGEERWFIDSRP